MKTLQESPANRGPFSSQTVQNHSKRKRSLTDTKQATQREKKKRLFPRRVQHEKPSTVASTLLRHSQARVKQLLPYRMDGWMLAGQGTFSFH
jgi:hypothetical protein